MVLHSVCHSRNNNMYPCKICEILVIISMFFDAVIHYITLRMFDLYHDGTHEIF